MLVKINLVDATEERRGCIHGKRQSVTYCRNKRPSNYYIIQTLDSHVVLSILQIKHTTVTHKPVEERVRRWMSQNSYSLPSDVNFFHNRYESSVSNCVDICVDQKS